MAIRMHRFRRRSSPIGDLEPVVPAPFLPSNTTSWREVRGLALDQVYIGSCTNGWISDLRAAARVLEGRKIADGLRVIVIPDQAAIYRQALEEGLAKIFVDAGAAFSIPTCGPCIGAHAGVLADGERSSLPRIGTFLAARARRRARRTCAAQ